jgi:leucyl aminopeptidase
MLKGGRRFDCAILPVFGDGGDAATLAPLFAARPANSPLAWLAGSGALADHGGKVNDLTLCHAASAGALPRALLVGLGAKEDLSLDRYRAAVGTAVRRCRALRLARLAVPLAGLEDVAGVLGMDVADILRETVLAALLALYSCTEFRSEDARARGRKDREPEYFVPESLTVLHPDRPVPASLRASLRLAEAEAAGVCLARDLVNAPANIMTPARMAEEAVALARRHGFSCRVLSKAEMAKLGMGALLAVAEGSRKDARFIVLEYVPSGAKKQTPFIMIGKGITFESGGISLKPAAGMHLMKGDMAGGAAVLGAFEAIGRCGGVSQPVVGLIPCTENMPGGSALRPGDIVTALSGKTVEILNTDAEGRLILCDALAYARKNWTPCMLVDIATLTGACVVALGKGASGLFTDHAPLRDAIMQAGGFAGEAFWPMPLWERLRDGLKSDVADIANVGPREGGAIAAALFLQAFVDKNLPWAHLDMAGAGIAEKETPLCPRGATGFGVRTLFALARRLPDAALCRQEKVCTGATG